MKVIDTISQFRNEIKNHEHPIALVPTMGALHEGHLALVNEARKTAKTVVVSIFVNPIQFNNAVDLEKYPRTFHADSKLLTKEHCDILFYPSVEEMYPSKSELKIDFGYQNKHMEGKFRPGHFNGVGIVVAKLFNIIQPDLAFFGQKDLQQCIVIQQLVKELSFPIDIKIIDTKREQSGLAMSSRNARLSEDARAVAPVLYMSLLSMAEGLKNNNFEETKAKSQELLSLTKQIKEEYIEVVEMESGKVVSKFEKGKKYGICIAAFVGNVRLIDNIIVDNK